MCTWGSLPAYFMAILLSYSLSKGHFDHLLKYFNHITWLTTFVVFSWCAQNGPILTNTLSLIPPQWNFLYIVGIRFVVLLEMLVFMVYLHIWGLKRKQDARRLVADALRAESSDNNANLDASGQRSEVKAEAKGTYSFLKSLSRASFAIYLSNYYFIRSDFFIERGVFHNSLYGLVSCSPQLTCQLTNCFCF